MVDASGASKGIKELGSSIGGLSRETQIAILSSQNLTKTQMGQALASAGLTKDQISQALATHSLKVAQDSATASTWSWAAAWNGLKAAIASNPIGFALTAITTVLSVTVMAVDTYKRKQQELIDSANELTQTYKQAASDISQSLSTVHGLEDEFEQLSRGVSDYGENISLSADEYKRYQEIVQQILGISPQLISGYDNEGNAIANKNNLIETSIKLLREENRLKLEGITSNESIVSIGVAQVQEYAKLLDDVREHQAESFYSLMGELGGQRFGNIQQAFFKELAGSLSGDTFTNMDDFWAWGKVIQDNAEEVYQNMLVQTDIFAQSDLNKFKAYIDKRNQLSKDIENQSVALNPTLQMVPQTLTAYGEMSNAQKDFITQYINGFKITADTTEEDLSAMRSSILSFVESLANNESAKSAINEIFSIDKDRPIAEVEELTNQLIQQIANSLGEDVETIRLRLGVAIDTDALKNNLKEAQPEIKQSFDEIAKEFSEDEIKIILNADFDWTAGSIDELRTVFDAFVVAAENAARETAFNNLLDETKEKIYLLRDAMREQSETGQISADTYRAIYNSGEDYQKLVEVTGDGLVILTEETEKYIDGIINAAIEQSVLNGYSMEQIILLAEMYERTAAYNEQLDAMQSAYSTVATAIDEYNESGAVSVDTFQALLKLSPEYLAALDLENGKLVINEQAIRALTDAMRDEAIQKLQSAAVSDIKALADGRVEDMSALAKDAVANLGDAAVIAGEQMAEGAEGALTFAAGVAAVLAAQGIDTGEITDAADAITKAYEDAAKKIGSLKIDFSTTASSKKSSSKSSSSKKEVDAHLEEYKKLNKDLDHIYAMGLISEEEYYRRRMELANQYLKGHEKYLDEYRKILEADYKFRMKQIEDLRKAEIKAAEDSYRAQKEAAEDSYKAQKKAADDAYNAQRKALEKQRDLLNDQLDAYKKLIDYQKKLLKRESDAHDFDKEVEESNKRIADLQAQIEALSLDDSAKANAKRIELQEELNKEKSSLEEKQYDRSIDLQDQALDDEYARYKEHIDSQTKLLDDQLKALNDSHDRMIDNMQASHEAMLSSLEISSQAFIQSIESKFDHMVNEAVSAANQIAAAFEYAYAKGQSSSNVMAAQTALEAGGYSVGSTGIDGIWGKQTEQAFVEAWQTYLNNLGAGLKIDGIRGPLTKAAEQRFGVVFPSYHTGGVVGEDIGTSDKKEIIELFNLSPDEVFAKLLKGEGVMTGDQLSNLGGTLTKVQQTLLDTSKIAAVLGGIQSANHLSAMTDKVKDVSRVPDVNNTSNIILEQYNDFRGVNPADESKLKKFADSIVERSKEAVAAMVVKGQVIGRGIPVTGRF